MVLVYHILSSLLAELQKHIVVRVGHEGMSKNGGSIFWIKVQLKFERGFPQFFTNTRLDSTGIWGFLIDSSHSVVEKILESLLKVIQRLGLCIVPFVTNCRRFQWLDNAAKSCLIISYKVCIMNLVRVLIISEVRVHKVMRSLLNSKSHDSSVDSTLTFSKLNQHRVGTSDSCFNISCQLIGSFECLSDCKWI